MTISAFSYNSSANNSLPKVIALHSELVRGTETQILAELLPRVQQQSIALDLSCVERIDAAGIATLITLYCSSVESGNTFCLLSPSSHVRELLHLVGLEPILLAGNCADSKPECSKKRPEKDARESILTSSAA